MGVKHRSGGGVFVANSWVRTLIASWGVALVLCCPLRVQADPGALCSKAAHAAAVTSEVPFEVLMAVSLTETGRSDGADVQAWPWTVNIKGQGYWFPTKAEATAFAVDHYDQGARSFDVGCFQINYRWHGQHFRSIEDMFDPVENAQYAARFLAELYQEKGSWPAAAGAYHSRTKTYADRYQTRFETQLARLTESPAQPVHPTTRLPPREVTARPSIQTTNQNSFPLLISRPGLSRMGSLVPVTGLVRSNHLFLRSDDG